MTNNTKFPNEDAKAAPKAKAAPVIVELNEEAKAHVAAMFEAIEDEALAIEAHKIGTEAATNGTWAVCRDHTFALIKADKFPYEVTKLALKELARNCAAKDEDGKAVLPRGIQYASNLVRAPKLLCYRDEEGQFGVIPAEMYQAGRSDWNKAACWDVIKGKQGAPKKEADKTTPGEFATDEEKAAHRESIGQALVEIMDDFVPVHAALAAIPKGMFRDEAVQAALAAIEAVKARQVQATGGSR